MAVRWGLTHRDVQIDWHPGRHLYAPQPHNWTATPDDEQRCLEVALCLAGVWLAQPYEAL